MWLWWCYYKHTDGVELHDRSLNSALGNSLIFYRDVRDSQPAHLLQCHIAARTLLLCKAWHETAEPRKEIATGCCCTRSN